MNRPYGRRRLEKMYADLRRDVPAIALRTTVMVGYPGEGKKEFGELLDFLRDCPFENLGAFVFSPQSGTAAAELPGRVPAEEAEERYHRVPPRDGDGGSHPPPPGGGEGPLARQDRLAGAGSGRGGDRPGAGRPGRHRRG